MTNARRLTARRLRQTAADLAFRRPHPVQVTNGEEEIYPNRIANFSKGLPHNRLGEVDPAAYRALLKAITTANPEDFERIPLGTPDGLKLANPQAGLAFDLQGLDASAVSLPPPPRINSAQTASEMAELYWMALLRDVPFGDFEGHPLVARAAESLSEFSRSVLPHVNGHSGTAALFRGITLGDQHGPRVSQFLLRDVPHGTLTLQQRQRTAQPGVDHLTDYASWLAAQNGVDWRDQAKIDTTPRYMRSMRDLAHYVHHDAPAQPYLNACLILLGLGAPPDPGAPYPHSHTQQGYGTFGAPHILGLVSEVATHALKAVWYQKWNVHRRLRPERFGGLVHNHLTTSSKYPLHRELVESDVLLEVFSQTGGYLLPQAYPEGCPLSPAYGAGHAAVAGACVTVLKAWFDETWPLPDAVTASADGTRLTPYQGGLTVGDELDKLAGNIGLGCCMAGINWRSDYTAALKLGEELAIEFLEEQQDIYSEEFEFSVTRFDGTSITLAKQSLAAAM